LDRSARPRVRSARWWQRLDHLFALVCALPAAKRTAFIEGACGDDPELRAELTSLVDHASSDPSSSPSFTTFIRQTREADPLVGRTLRQYTIEARLGRGGMGVVYRARDTNLDRPVALKFLRPTLSAGPAAKKRFLVEARAAAAIDHPNICTVYEVGEADDGAPFIAMAYYEGETLKEKLSRGKLPIGDAVDYVAQTAEGVRAAHACGVLHRDVKPGNVFITRAGVAKLLDFGAAKKVTLERTTGDAVIGTVGYMSPEQLRNEPVDARTDIWSLGAVLYEALASHPPFRGDDAAQIIRSILLDDLPPLGKSRPDALAKLEAVLRKALAKNRDDRYGTVTHFLSELKAAVAPVGDH
jgi:eukaryotic-like serine/threonine-protein kinase